MIDPNWSVVDLDPVTWRNIGRFLEPPQYFRAAQPGEHGLFVLHEAGRVLKVVDTALGTRRDLELEQVYDAPALARTLHARGEWQRVHVIDRQHLKRVARLSGSIEHRPLQLDQYYRLVHQLFWEDTVGYVCEPPKPDWNHFTYDLLEQFVSRLPQHASLALGVFDGTHLNIGLILEFKSGSIVRVTTFEAPLLQLAPIELSTACVDRLWQQLDQHIAPTAAVLLCTQAAFDQWITAEDKTQALHVAVRDGAALLRLTID
jgi:hypothetical protein